MKESLTLIGVITAIFLFICAPACTPIDHSVYRCSITYTLDKAQHTTTMTMDIPSMYVPAYSCGNGKIKLIGVGPGDYQWYYKDIYAGPLDATVQKFDYTFIRSYKASRWDGHELKNKKK